MERLSAEGKFFHRGCFRCEYCSTSLRIGNICTFFIMFCSVNTDITLYKTEYKMYKCYRYINITANNLFILIFQL